jgi:hypothetical protein
MQTNVINTDLLALYYFYIFQAYAFTSDTFSQPHNSVDLGVKMNQS